MGAITPEYLEEVADIVWAWDHRPADIVTYSDFGRVFGSSAESARLRIVRGRKALAAAIRNQEKINAILQPFGARYAAHIGPEAKKYDDSEAIHERCI